MFLIIMPYYCHQEIRVFLELARLWKAITKTKLYYEFLFVCRHDITPNKTLERRFSRIAPVRTIRNTTQGKGFIHAEKGAAISAPTAMFWDTFEYINTHYTYDKDFALWFEWDMLPLVPSWLDQLAREWVSGDYVVMGRLIDSAWLRLNAPAEVQRHVPRHINGGACYCKDFAAKVPKDKCDLKRPWDMEIFKHIEGRLPYKATQLIELRFWNNATLLRPPEAGSAILHGIKDMSARNYVRRHFLKPKIFFSFLRK